MCMENNLIIENFIKCANIKHNNKYQYTQINFKNRKDKINIICDEHGEFIQRVDHHLNGSGCPKCVGKNKDNQQLIDSYRLIHGDRYDYSLVDYKNAKTKIKILCKTHGVFEIYSKQHLNGVNCSQCVRNRIATGQRLTTEKFIENAKLTHGNTYDYTLVNYIKATVPVTIICKKHGNFNQIPRTHIRGSGCPICRESKGERKIREFLTKNKIKFTPQKKFDDCKNVRMLPFDFYLPDHNTCIEFHGEQHYKNKKHFGGENQLEYTQHNDNIKTKYCFNRGINIIVINYNQIKSIDSLLRFHLKLS